jgi:murein DD-endopeptidase MepM/ murein hydrolase activator NlpD
MYPLLQRYLLFLIFLTYAVELSSQSTYPVNYFIPPVDYRIFLSGTFGELRDDHFHSGIDIKTGGAEGKKIYAAADGYISRINISPYGYGKALYITHPNGYVSVYGHLKSFSPTISEYVRRQQYKKESFAIDITLDKEELPVKKGETIALSGSSGSSGGPHLHFEIRDGLTQQTINPLLFGIDVKDAVKPKIQAVKIYALDASTRINGSTDTVSIAVEKRGNTYYLAHLDTLRVTGSVAFGIQTFDQQSDDDNPNGIYSIELSQDGRSEFSIVTGKFSFNETRYINALIDYAEFMKSKRRFIRTDILPNNRLSLYKSVNNRGILTFQDEKLHKIEYVVKDVKGNSSTLKFYIRSFKPGPFDVKLSAPVNHSSVIFHFDRPNDFTAAGIYLHLNENCLYNNIHFTYSYSAKKINGHSGIHRVNDIYTPVHDYFDLWIKPDSVPAKYLEKAFLVKLENGLPVYAGGNYDDDFIKAKVRSFGDYVVAVDTVTPVIKAINMTDNMNLNGLDSFMFQISDESSGIKSYKGTLNGEWILMDYDAKNNLLKYEFDDRLKKGQNIFILIVTDNMNNTNTYQSILNY